jgi:four helix bundle protein
MTIGREYNLEERTAKFGENIIRLCKTLRQNTISTPVINQIVRSSTSVGANYCEANAASSKKDFKNKIFICKKEAQETKHWLRMLVACDTGKRDECRKLWQEAQELTLIFGKIVSKLKN